MSFFFYFSFYPNCSKSIEQIWVEGIVQQQQQKKCYTCKYEAGTVSYKNGKLLFAGCIPKNNFRKSPSRTYTSYVYWGRLKSTISFEDETMNRMKEFFFSISSSQRRDDYYCVLFCRKLFYLILQQLIVKFARKIFDGESKRKKTSHEFGIDSRWWWEKTIFCRKKMFRL